MKVTEKTPVYDYRVPRDVAAKLKESTVIGIEVLDGILNAIFGFHVLEPLVSFEDFPKVKPIMQAVKPSQAEAVTLMNKAKAEAPA